MADLGDVSPGHRHSAAESGTVSLLRDDLAPEFEVLRPLGRGAAGGVFLAREPGLKRLVAIKVLWEALATDIVARARFEREAAAAAALNHPNAVAVHRFGYTSTGLPYLVMQYVSGVTLEERLAAEGPLEASEVRRVLAEVAEAVAEAHRHGFVHRDLRPGNVLCDRETGRALVTDFGVAALLPGPLGAGTRITRAGEILSAPDYASPEQLLGEPVTEGSDVYALGIMGYEMLTGEGPFRARSAAEIEAAHLRSPPRPLASLVRDVDPELADLLQRCLAKDPRRRPDAPFLARALRSATHARRAGAGESLPPAGPGGRDLVADVLRRRLPHIVAATVVLGYAALSFVDQLADRDVVPELAYSLALTTFGYGVAASGVVGWFHGKKGRQRVPAREVVLLAVIVGAWALTSVVLVLL